MNFLVMLRNLASAPVPDYISKDAEKEPTVISLRPSWQLRHYLEFRAAQLGNMSLHALIITMLKAYQNAESSSSNTDGGFYQDTIALIAGRLRHLFSFHQYLPHEISNILKEFSVTPSVLLDDTKLVDALPEGALWQIAEAFGVDKDWICGKDTTSLCYRQPLRHNAHGIYKMALEYSKTNELEKIIPFCREGNLDGNKLVYENHGEEVPVSIALMLKPMIGYRHPRCVLFEPTLFDYEDGRLEYKSLLYALHEKFSSESTFEGQRLSDDEWDSVIGRGTLFPASLFDRRIKYWDAELYVGAQWGNHPRYEQDELEQVKQLAHDFIQ